MFAADINKFLFDSFKRKGTKKKKKKKDSLPRRLGIEYKFYRTTTYFARDLNTFEKKLLSFKIARVESNERGFDDGGGYEQYSKKYDVYTYNMI